MSPLLILSLIVFLDLHTSQSQTPVTIGWSSVIPNSVKVGSYSEIKAEGCGLTTRTQTKTENRIFNGTTAQLGEFPWAGAMVEMIPPKPGENHWFPIFICGVSVISEYWILTAKHCFFPLDENFRPYPVKYENFKFFFGTTHWSRSDYIYDLDYFFYHIEFDIALAKVKTMIKPVTDGNKYIVNYVCLPETEYLNSKEEEAIYSGWGWFTNYKPEGSNSKYLRKSKITIKAAIDCQQYMIYPLYPSNYDYFVCAEVNDTISCAGDSGSGLVQFDGQRAVLVGLVREHGPFPNKCEPPGYILFTRTSMFIGWIKNTISSPPPIKPQTTTPTTTPGIPTTTPEVISERTVLPWTFPAEQLTISDVENINLAQSTISNSLVIYIIVLIIIINFL